LTVAGGLLCGGTLGGHVRVGQHQGGFQLVVVRCAEQSSAQQAIIIGRRSPRLGSMSRRDRGGDRLG